MLGSEGVTAVLCSNHLPPPLHAFSWLGTLRPSAAASGLIAQLGSGLPQPQLAKLESTKVCTVIATQLVWIFTVSAQLGADSSLAGG